MSHCDSCILDVLDEIEAMKRKMQERIDLFEKRVFVRKYSRKKQSSRPIFMSRISREVREAKNSSEERRYKNETK